MKKKIKITIIIFILLVVGVFINGCVFVFCGPQEYAHKKVLQGKDLNLYEKVSAYTMITPIIVAGWVTSPETSYITFCKKYHLPLSYSDMPIVWENDSVVRCTIKSFQYIGEKKRLSYGTSYPFDWRQPRQSRVSLALNGIEMRCDKMTQDSVMATLLLRCNYPKCKSMTQVGPIRISETLIWYLDQIGWLATPTINITKMYKRSTL